MVKVEEEDWWDRLSEAIRSAKAAGRSYRKISDDADLGPNFVGQMMKDGKAPGADKVVRLCRALGVSVTYIFTGTKMTQEAEEMLKLWSQLDDEGKQSFLGTLRSMQRAAEVRK